MNKHLTDAQQAQFASLITSILTAVGDEFESDLDTFMIPPLRYSQSVIRPKNKKMSRATMCRRLEAALEGKTQSVTEQGKGVYLRNQYHVGDFIVEVACATRGGRLICFSAA